MSSEGRIVLSYHDALLRESDVALLQGPHWLNDIVLAFWFEVLEKHLLVDYAKDIAFISPQVSQFLKLCEAEEASLMLEPLHLSTKKLILLPVNDSQMEEKSGGSHWSLLTFKQSEGFFHYDSYAGANRYEAVTMATALGPNLGWDVGRYPPCEENCPVQGNGYDCGIHVLCNTERICQKFIGGSASLRLNFDPRTKRKHILETINNFVQEKQGQS